MRKPRRHSPGGRSLEFRVAFVGPLRGVAMPTYTLRVEEDGSGEEVELMDDAAAWSALVAWSAEILKDIDGKLPPHPELTFSITEGERVVADLRVCANRPSQFPQS